MADVGTTFEKLLGRQPSDKEIQNLYRIKNTLNIRDNDALWLVLMALESYDTLYRKYPGMISNEVKKMADDQRALFTAMADAEMKRVLATFVDTVRTTSESLTERISGASRLQALGWALLGALTFGSLCVFVGFILGSGNLPYWAAPSPGDGPARMIIGALARTPAGWISSIFVTGLSVAAAWNARAEIRSGKKIYLLLSSIVLFALSVSFLFLL